MSAENREEARNNGLRSGKGTRLLSRLLGGVSDSERESTDDSEESK
jgi:hypothetical protein